jgi:hypothetical protein
VTIKFLVSKASSIDPEDFLIYCNYYPPFAYFSSVGHLMTDYIDKESWCQDGLHGKKFHHRSVTSKRCPGCGDRNPNPIDDIDGLSDVDKDLSGLRRHPDPNRDRFTQVPSDAEFRDLTESPTHPLPRSLSLPGPQRLYIQKGVGEQGRQDSIAKDPTKKPDKIYSATKQFKLDVRPCRQIESKNSKGFMWAIKDNGKIYINKECPSH